jgi:DNA helicase-2/ATP-dependent DNA helicase PcrA
LLEIPPSLLEIPQLRTEPTQRSTAARPLPAPKPSLLRPIAVASPAASVPSNPANSVPWKVGDRASHGKWGIGTVVEVKGSGDNQEVKIAFPDQGIKSLSIKFAPIQRV